jgi:hypothetical protein
MQHRWSPVLGTFENSPEKIWGVTPYDPESLEPCVFCGIYGLPDFYPLWRYKGKKYIWWTGSDIRHFVAGYWLDKVGEIRVDPKPLAEWISKNCESWVENEVEAEALRKFGIESHACPSFLGDVNDFEVSFKPNKVTKLYASVSGDDFLLYGWDKIPYYAVNNPEVEFHCYGNTIDYFSDEQLKRLPNIIVHGRVPKEQFNKEIKEMQGGLRLVPFDGCSEIIVKSVLMGQYPISLIKYPHVFEVGDIELLRHMTEPNYKGREWFLANLNKYPWSK